MKIIFSSLNSGLGNNGGSRTILKCSEVLRSQGHESDIAAEVDNFTWFDHRPVISMIPDDTDVAIATACTTVGGVVHSAAPKKAWYIRAHENWAASDQDLGYLYRHPEFLNIVNSKCLQHKLNEDFHADSVVVYQGLDFDWWEDRNIRPKDKIRIGCLHTVQPRKRWKDFVELANILGHDDYEYVGMGNSTPVDTDFLTEFTENANVEQLNDLYSSCHVWFAPTDSEGLHNPPMEAALCGCLIVCSDHKLNGMVLDYAFDGYTAMVYEFGNIKQASDLIRHPDFDLVKNMQDGLRTVIGTREDNMKRLVGYLEEL